MKKLFNHIFILSALTLILIFPYFVFAEGEIQALVNLQQVGETDGPYITTDDTTWTTIISSVINVIIGLLGVIFVVLIIYAGFNWMTAAGDEGKIETAKKTLTRAIIGLIIIAGSYAIWNFVFNALLK